MGKAIGHGRVFQLYSKYKKALNKCKHKSNIIYIDGQQAHEKILNIPDYQRNANKNYNEEPPHTGQNGHHEKAYKLKMLEKNKNKHAGKDVEKREPPTLLVGT